MSFWSKYDKFDEILKVYDKFIKSKIRLSLLVILESPPNEMYFKSFDIAPN